MRPIATVLACLYLSACAAPPTRPPLGQVLVITGAVIVAGAIAEHHQANHLVPTPSGATRIGSRRDRPHENVPRRDDPMAKKPHASADVSGTKLWVADANDD
jgi:hypothetical protein